MRIAEIFRSVQGEGRLTGVESVFVRASGCNLRCGYCDTPYASWTPEGEDLSVAEVLARVEQLWQAPRPAFLEPHLSPLPMGEGSGVRAERPLGQGSEWRPPRHVVLTGGEPMLFAELIPLTAALHERRWHITIETAGTLYLPVRCDLMSISPKLSNSIPSPDAGTRWTERHAAARHAPEVVRRLMAEYDYQLKFVIDSPDDCREVETWLAELPQIDRHRVMLMPQGTAAAALAERSAWLQPYCTSHGLTFCPRRQIEWFGMQRGT